jgi:hypothetical protein
MQLRQVKMISEADEYGVIFTRALEEDAKARCLLLPASQKPMAPVVEVQTKHQTDLEVERERERET